MSLVHFRPKKGKKAAIERIYFIYSFGFLITRTVAVSLFAAQVDSESKQPFDLLTSLPHDIDNIEVEMYALPGDIFLLLCIPFKVDRLMDQVKMDPSALTGRRFFTITKSLILSVCYIQ